MPTRTLLRDNILVAMARYPAKNVADLDAIRGLPRPVETRYGRQIVAATAKALALPESKLPPPEPTERQRVKAYVDRVWAEISEFCMERSIAPALVGSRKEVFRFCHAVAHGEPLGEFRLGRGWRSELLGELLVRIL